MQHRRLYSQLTEAHSNFCPWASSCQVQSRHPLTLIFLSAGITDHSYRAALQGWVWFLSRGTRAGESSCLGENGQVECMDKMLGWILNLVPFYQRCPLGRCCPKASKILKHINHLEVNDLDSFRLHTLHVFPTF